MTTSNSPYQPPSIDAYDRRILDGVAEHGWMVQYVAPTQADVDRGDAIVPFAYTVGLTPLGLPELVVSGLPARVATHMLNDLARAQLPGDGYEPGTTVTHDNWPDLAFRVAACPDAEINMARHLYGPSTRAVQVVWPDAAGLYPGQPGCEVSEEDQPVYDGRGSGASPAG